MEKKICSYELLFVINGEYSEEEYTAVKEKFTALINDNATESEVAEWGKRRLAYPINDITDGYYVLANFKSEPDFPLEIERVLGITDGVLRYMTVAKSEKAAKAAAAVAEAEVAEEAEEAAAEPVAEEAPAEAPAEESAEA